jgi:prevent-host-death family protein
MPLATIHQAKTSLSRLIAQAERGEEVVIARGKQPVVRLVPVKPPSNKRKLGIFRGEFALGPGFFEPLPPEELAGWE